MSPLTLFASVSVFQSTPPVKAATCIHSEGSYGNGISIHAAREGGDMMSLHVAKTNDISIHAAREGGDAGTWFHSYARDNFNPRRP